jgi:hypothetical protein
MSKFMIIAVTDYGAEGSGYQDVGLYEGSLAFNGKNFCLKNSICYAYAGESVLTGDKSGTVVDEKGAKKGDIILDKPFEIVWGNDKQELIHKFLVHDYGKLI